MANVLEFVIKLNDMMSGGLRKVQSNALQSFKGMSDAATKFNTTNIAVCKNIDQLSSALDHLKNKRNTLDITNPADLARLRVMNSEIKNLEKNMSKFQTLNGSKVKTWAKDAFNQVPGAGLISNPLVMAGTAAAYSVKQAMDVQASKVKFSTLMGGEAMGNHMYGQLKSYADVTPYSKDDTLKSGETLLNYGVASTKVLPVVKMLGDISGGSAERLQSLSLAFGQVSAKGHLAGQEVLQMVNAGFNPLQAISEKTGKSMNDLDKMMRDGKITTDMVTGAMQAVTGEGGRFHGMMEKLGGTLQGKISTFLDRINTTAAKLGETILPAVNAALGGLNSLFGFLSENGQAIAFTLGVLGIAFVAANTEAIGMSIGFRLASISTGFLTSTMWTLTAAMLANPITWIIAGIAALVVGVKYAWNHFEGFRKVVLGVWEVMKNFGTVIKDYVINRITELLQGIQLVGSALAKLFKGDFSGAWSDAKGAAQAVLGIGSAQKAGQQIAGIYGEGAAKGSASWKADQDKKYKESLVKSDDPLYKTVSKAYDIAHSQTLQKETFGGNAKALNEFLGLAKNITKSGNILKTNQKGSAMDYIMALQDAMKGKNANGAAPDGDPENSTTKGITSGGPRVINITGVKFIEKFELHAATVGEGIAGVEAKLNEAFIRLLYSGAKMQS